MRPALVSLCGLVTIATAQAARFIANEERATEVAEPFAPSPQAAPFLSLGYRELAADLMFFRLVGYVGGKDYSAEGVASLVEATHAMDPRHKKIYEWGALAMMFAARKDQRNDTALARDVVKHRGSITVQFTWHIRCTFGAHRLHRHSRSWGFARKPRARSRSARKRCARFELLAASCCVPRLLR